MSGFTSVSIDGVPMDVVTASIPVSDIGFIRGFGVFEVIRGIDGRCFRLHAHLARLQRSAAMLGIELPAPETIGEWAMGAAAHHDDSVIRILVSAGDDPFDGTARVVVTSEPLPASVSELTLLPVLAPWHSDGERWELCGAKTLSYANNLGAIRAAQLEGFDDALLVGRTGRILEGPTFSVGWVVDEGGRTVYETPSMSLGILDSITRQLAFDSAEDAGLEIREVEVGLDRLDDATELFVLSTLRKAVSVTAVGERVFSSGPATRALRSAIAERTSQELLNEPR
jgi:4-amino-4-deoxychorismate lyase